uniref:Tektin n=1 Tax=Zonotrichia albicollis TaxID=44394 RepID=A0A8D2MXP8_ZONAL
MGYWESISLWEGGQALAQGSQNSWGCPWIPGSAQGQAGHWGWSSLGQWELSLPWQGWHWMGFNVPSNPNHLGFWAHLGGHHPTGSLIVPLFSSLVQEVNEINETLRNLHQCLRASEDMLQMLVRSKGVLEHDLVVKNNSLFIDQERCMGMRKSYPSTVQILGYVSAGLT